MSKPRLWPLSSLVDRPTCWGGAVTVRCGCEKGTAVHYSWYQNTQLENVLLDHSPDIHLHCGTVVKDSSYYCLATNSISKQSSDVLSVQLIMPADSSCIYVIKMQGKNNFSVFYCKILPQRHDVKPVFIMCYQYLKNGP